MNVISQAFDILKQRSQTVKKNADNTLQQALKNKEIYETYSLCRTLVFEISKQEFKGEDCEILNKKLKDGKIKFLNLLKQNNIDINDIKRKNYCLKCKDIGKVNGKNCECLNKIINELLIVNSGLKKDLPKFSDVNFNIFDANKKNVKKIYDITQNFVNNTTDTPQTLLIVGKTGVGKTHLLECAVNEALAKKLFVLYVTAFDLNQTFLKYHISPLLEKSKIFETVLNCDILCIDDLGTENILKNVTIEYLFLILNERLISGKKTIITTNLSLDKIIDVYDERIFSRLVGGDNILIEFKGTDLRLRKS